ncbi:MAG: hypothetical protein EBW98_02185 [Actinobacteria bacterium]|nr:hypothetical protein [Actinomycetota bacterium]
METIRYTIKQHDHDHPEVAVFGPSDGRLRPETCERIYHFYMQGEPVESIATRNDGSSQGVRVMTLREGDKVAGIAAFRTGLAKRDADGENEGAPDGEASPPRTKAAKAAATKTPAKGKAQPAAKVKANSAKASATTKTTKAAKANKTVKTKPTKRR